MACTDALSILPLDGDASGPSAYIKCRDKLDENLVGVSYA